MIMLPVSSATLTGTATGNDGATVTTVSWKQDSGPATATIASPSSVSTAVTGMTVAGSYIFTFYATDDNGSSANGSMTVTVDPATTPAAITGQAIVQTGAMVVADSVMAGQATGTVLYPNPANDLLNIQLNDPVTGKVVVSVFNLAGNCVRRIELEKDWWILETSIDVSGLPKGMYVVQVVTGIVTRSAGKFIKL
jgi:hypothetical protein